MTGFRDRGIVDVQMAYIDPTAGGLLLQAVFGGVAAFFVFFWKRFVGLFRKSPLPPAQEAGPPKS